MLDSSAKTPPIAAVTPEGSLTENYPNAAKEKTCSCGNPRCRRNTPAEYRDYSSSVAGLIAEALSRVTRPVDTTPEVKGLGQLTGLLDKLAAQYNCTQVVLEKEAPPQPSTDLRQLFDFTKQAQEDARKSPAQPGEDQTPVEEAVEDSNSPEVSNLGILVGDRASKTRVFVEAGHDAYEVSNVISAKLDFDGEVEYPVLTLKILCPQVVYPTQE